MADFRSRLDAEVALLEAMYPEQVFYSPKRAELEFRSDLKRLILRIPDQYPETAKPTVLLAECARCKSNPQAALRDVIAGIALGEELLDSVISAFVSMSDDPASPGQYSEQTTTPPATAATANQKCTVVVWLHHLLNTNKRKQVLHPSSLQLSGVSKPGYPGVLIFSGPSKEVHQHVNELKALNWQAFQVRLEVEDQWTYDHGHGVKEVETMADVVREIGEEHKSVFLDVMKMR
ncbi:MAG: hypothetical protein M1828_001439 [Chrysothrix sp. TS-e1954]|nr:MAG: hypothetical protein M1828_001439 [Chrysothrix sp. TS-e1954]